MRLDVVPVPNALHGAPAHPSLTGHRTNSPPDSSLRRSSGSFKDQRDFLRRKSLFAPPSRRIFKTTYSLLVKALSPFTNRSQTATKLFGYLCFGLTFQST